MAAPRSAASSSRCVPEESWRKRSLRQAATTSPELPSSPRAGGSGSTYVQVHLDGVAAEDGEGGQVSQSPQRERGCGTQGGKRLSCHERGMPPTPGVPAGMGASGGSCSQLDKPLESAVLQQNRGA